MTPRLYERNQTEFDSYGLCALVDCISCEVTEERNGEFVLEMTYARNGRWADQILVDRIILAKPNDTATQGEPFRISEVVFDLNGNLEISAQHISYQLNSVIVGACHGTGSPTFAWNMFNENLKTANPFTFYSDIQTTTSPVFGKDVPTPLRSLIGGSDDSLVELFGGELYWNQYAVNLLSSRGHDNGVKIAYTKNLTGLKYDVDMDDYFSGVVAYYKSGETYLEGTLQTITNDYGYDRVKVVDASSSFESTPTLNQLNRWAAEYLEQNATGPTISVDVDFVPLWQTEEYKAYQNLEYVNLCDTVTILYPPLNLSMSAKVVKTVYDVLAERYTKISINTIKATLADTIYSLMEAQNVN